MDFRDFCYWLQGFAELDYGEEITQRQWTIIKEHLEKCFNKEPINQHKILNDLQPYKPEVLWGGLKNVVQGSC